MPQSQKLTQDQSVFGANTSTFIRGNNLTFQTTQQNSSGLQDSFINNTMIYTSDTPIRDCTTPVAMCLLQFTGKCSGLLCYGVYCEYHSQLTSSRVFVGQTNPDRLTTRVVSVSQTQMRGRFMHTITSILPTGKNLSYYEAWTKDLTNISHDERMVLAKFFCLICNAESSCISNADHALLKQYLNEVAAYYFNIIRIFQVQLTDIKVPLSMTIEQRDELLKTSKWFNDVLSSPYINVIEHKKNEEMSTKTIVTYFIPILKFNAFDVLNFMTFNLEPALTEEGYLPNCELVHTHIVHGTNYGIHNYVDTYNLVNNNFNYSPQLNSAINQTIKVRIGNLDVLTIYCISDSVKNTSFIEMPIALLKQDSCAKFNLSAIRAPELFKYR